MSTTTTTPGEIQVDLDDESKIITVRNGFGHTIGLYKMVHARRYVVSTMACGWDGRPAETSTEALHRIIETARTWDLLDEADAGRAAEIRADYVQRRRDAVEALQAARAVLEEEFFHAL